MGRQTPSHSPKEEVRTCSSRCYDQIGSSKDSHYSSSWWKQEIPCPSLEQGNFAWGSEAITRKTRIIDVVYNAANNELVRTKTLVKNAIVVIDATPFRQWYEAHYALPLGHKKNQKLTEAEEAVINKKRSNKTKKKFKERQKEAKVEAGLEDEFASGRVWLPFPLGLDNVVAL